MSHRGPDQSAVISNMHAVFGHNRLSIIDLEAGPQPLVSECKRYILVYNGEIYNFKAIRAKLKKMALISAQIVTLKLY